MIRESSKKIDPKMLAEYSMQNLESLYLLGINDNIDKKIPKELLSYACRAFPRKTKMLALCKKFHESFGTHLMEEITRENNMVGDMHTPCNKIVMSSASRLNIVKKAEDIWKELLLDNNVNALTQEVQDRIELLVTKSQNNYCKYCLKYVEEFQEYLKNHQDNVENHLLRMCKMAPSRTIEQVCYVTVLIYGPRLIDYIKDQSPQKVCKKFCENPSISFH